MEKKKTIKIQDQIFLVISFLCVHALSFAQIPHLIFTHINHEHGLSSSSVETIFQDNRGFVWFGTLDGLDRYDGNQIKVYRNNRKDPRSISDNYIHSIFEDQQHRLWIGTSNGLNLFNPVFNNFTQYRHHSKYTNLNGDKINSILQGSDQTLWICTTWGSLSHFDINSGRFTDYFYDNHFKAPAANRNVYCLAVRDKNSFWVGTQNGLKVFDLKRHCFSDSLNPFKIKFPFKIRTIGMAANKIMWLGTEENGLLRVNLVDNKITSFTHVEHNPGSLGNDRIISMLIDDKNRLFVGTVNGGLNIFNDQSNTFTIYTNNPAIQSSLSQRSVAAIYEDKQRNIWIGTPRGGINLASLQKERFDLFRNEIGPQSLSYNDVKSFCEDRNGDIWVGTDGGGLNYFTRSSRTFKVFRFDAHKGNSIGSDQVMSLCTDHLGNLWVGTFDGGLNLFNYKTGTFTRFIHHLNDSTSLTTNMVESILEDHSHRLWVCTYNGGLDLFDPVKKKFKLMGQGATTQTKIFGIKLLSITEDHDGRLWVVTDDAGLNRYDPRTGLVSHYFEGNNNPDLAVVFADHAGRIWVGKKGLYLYNPQKNSFSLFTSNGNLAADYIKGILEGRPGELWISTSNGIIRYDTNSGRYKVFNSNDGLQGPDFELNSCLKAKDGTMFFGGTNGFNTFVPGNITFNHFLPPVYFTNFYIFNKRVEPGGTSVLQQDIAYTKAIELKYSQSSIAFDFDALNFVKNENNSYAYKLENFDHDWNYIGHEHHAAYTNLDPGKYLLRVKASNNDGAWNPREATLAIIISPPFWKTWWFILLVFIAAMAGLYFVLDFKRRLDTNAIREKQKEDMHQLQLQFFTNISHEFRTPLSLILGPVETLMQTSSKPKESELYKTIQRNASRLMVLVNELMDFRKVESGVLKLKVRPFCPNEYLREITKDFSNLAIQKGIDFTVQLTEERELWFDLDILNKIIFNLLTNSIKYTNNGDRVSVGIFYTMDDLKSPFENELVIKNNFRASDYFFIRVLDNGIGISKESIKHLFERYYRVSNSHLGSGVGLAFVKNLTELHKGDIYVYSERLKGTEIIIALPLSESNYTDAEKWHEENAEGGVLLESVVSDMPYKDFGTELVRPGSSTAKPKYDEHILIVEDNDELRKFLKDELSVYYAVADARNGREGLLKVDEVFPDLIITDIMMPEMDGIEFSRSIKNNIETSHIPLIMLTARDGIESKIAGVTSGADVYFSKPFSIALLNITIRNIFDKQQKLRKYYTNAYYAEAHELVHSIKDKEFMDRFIQIIESQLFSPELDVDFLALEIAMSKSKLYQKIKNITGQSIVEFVRSFRLKKAIQIMTHEDVPLSEVMLRVGMQTQSYFTKSFKNEFGKTPTQFLNEIKSRSK